MALRDAFRVGDCIPRELHAKGGSPPNQGRGAAPRVPPRACMCMEGHYGGGIPNVDFT